MNDIHKKDLESFNYAVFDREMAITAVAKSQQEANTLTRVLYSIVKAYGEIKIPGSIVMGDLDGYVEIRVNNEDNSTSYVWRDRLPISKKPKNEVESEVSTDENLS